MGVVLPTKKKPSVCAVSDPARFNEAYFARFYGDARTRVSDAKDADRLAALVGGIVGYFGITVRRVLDAGCGIGLLKAPLAEQFPRATYTGLEYSEYLCQRHGWIQGSVQDYVSQKPYDLVLCHDVLQYLDDRTATRAIANLARLCQGALSLSLPTQRDWRTAADPDRSDQNVYRRPADWYQTRLRRHFRHLGCGVHVPKALRPISWELEQPWL